MFAIYHLPRRRGNRQYLGLSSLSFEVVLKRADLKIPLHDINKVILEKRRKLAPLISGGVLTSLSLVSIFLYSSSLEMVGLAAFGMLLTYFGLQEYVVIHLEHERNTSLLWLPLKISLSSIRPFVALLEYYISKQHFPVLFASASTGNLTHYESHPVTTKETIKYRFRQTETEGVSSLAVNITLLDNPIKIDGHADFIGTSNHLINQEALLDHNTMSYS